MTDLLEYMRASDDVRREVIVELLEGLKTLRVDPDGGRADATVQAVQDLEIVLRACAENGEFLHALACAICVPTFDPDSPGDQTEDASFWTDGFLRELRKAQEKRAKLPRR